MSTEDAARHDEAVVLIVVPPCGHAKRLLLNVFQALSMSHKIEDVKDDRSGRLRFTRPPNAFGGPRLARTAADPRRFSKIPPQDNATTNGAPIQRDGTRHPLSLRAPACPVDSWSVDITRSCTIVSVHIPGCYGILPPSTCALKYPCPICSAEYIECLPSTSFPSKGHRWHREK